MNKRGGDPDIGRKLPRMFLAAGVSEVGLHAVQPMSLVGEAKHINPVTLSAIGPAVLADGLATEDELAQIESELEEFANDPATLVAAPRVFQVWGRRTTE